MRPLTRSLIAAAVLTATALAASPSFASVPANRVLPTNTTIKPIFLTEAQIKKAIGLKTPMAPMASYAGTTTSTKVDVQQRYSPLGTSYDAYAKVYKGPFQYAQSSIIVNATDADTAKAFDTIRTQLPLTANKTVLDTPTKTISYKGSQVPGADKRTAYSYVFGNGLIAGGECGTYSKTTTEKQLEDCAAKVASAQWAKANPLIAKK